MDDGPIPCDTLPSTPPYHGPVAVVVPLRQIDPDLPFTTPDGGSQTGARTSLFLSPKELLECCFPEILRRHLQKHLSQSTTLGNWNMLTAAQSHQSGPLCSTEAVGFFAVQWTLGTQRLKPASFQERRTGVWGKLVFQASSKILRHPMKSSRALTLMCCEFS